MLALYSMSRGCGLVVTKGRLSGRSVDLRGENLHETNEISASGILIAGAGRAADPKWLVRAGSVAAGQSTATAVRLICYDPMTVAVPAWKSARKERGNG
jgi:hypothetical protein